jgi:protein-tyrosine phosphatase
VAEKNFVIMFVCTGNTCRSPMAHGILRSMIQAENISNVKIVSSGTGTLEGYPPTSNAVQASKNNGIDISDLYSQTITAEMVQAADLILALAYDHYLFIAQRYPDTDGRVFMLKAFPDKNPSRELSVEDPLGLDLEDYLDTHRELEAELKRAWPTIKQRIDEKLL